MFASRRDFLQTTGCGFGYLAWQAMAQSQAALANPMATKRPHHQPKAKRVIFLFMQGGVSHVDSYDYKPRLFKDDGKIIQVADSRAIAKTGKGALQARDEAPLGLPAAWRIRSLGLQSLPPHQPACG